MAGGLPPRAVAAHLLGSSNRSATWDLPCHLGVLARALDVPVADLIDRHTLLPYYASGLLPGRINRLRRWMAGSRHAGDIHVTAGITASAVPATQRLRYCVECAKEDGREWGSPVWRRLHQCPGVVWCVAHECPLTESDVNVSFRSHKHHAVDLRDAISAYDHAMVVADPRLSACIAVRSMELLAGTGPRNALAWRERHRDALERGPWLTSGRRVRWAKLLPELRSNLPSESWKAIGVRVDVEHPTHWLAALIRSPRKASHPLLHLLAHALLREVTAHSRESDKNSRGKSKRKSSQTSAAAPSAGAISSDRQKWRRLARECPLAGAKAWRTKEPALYARLYRHSRTWLRDWNSQRRKPQSNERQKRIDWERRDQELLDKLPAAQQALLGANPRHRVSMTCLLRQLQLIGLHQSQLAKLPKFKKAVSRMAETPREFLRRRLASAVRNWASEKGYAPAPWQILRAAGVRSPWSGFAKTLARSAVDLYPWMLQRRNHAEQDTGDANQGLALGPSCRSNAGRRRVS